MSSSSVQPSSAATVFACPSCGGAGGGPIGRLGGAWDTEDYVCPRCEGTGVVTASELALAATAAAKADAARTRVRPARPSVVKAAPPPSFESDSNAPAKKLAR